MPEQQLIGALEAGGTKMVCATGYADGTVLERERIATTTPQETVEAVNTRLADKGIAALGIGAFGSRCAKRGDTPSSNPILRDNAATPCISPQTEKGRRTKQCVLGGLFSTYEHS